MRKIFLFLFFFVISLAPVSSVFAESNYVLPYPSYMPGNFLYKPRLMLSKIAEYIYFGDFGKFDYSLKESDHYLVEAKILFEYKQYLLADQALKKSDAYFVKIRPSLLAAKRHGKNTSGREEILRNASDKHIETLFSLRGVLPQSYYWNPEQVAASTIEIRKNIDTSLRIRKEGL